jgi:hypothetical protein
MSLSRTDLTRQLDRWLLKYQERPAGRFVVRDGGRWLTLVADGGRWRWTTAKSEGTVADDGALEALLDRVFPR